MFFALAQHRFPLGALIAAMVVGLSAAGEEADEAQSAATAPLPTLSAARLCAETLVYKLEISVAGTRMPAEATLAIAKAQVKREGGTQAAWRISYREEGGVMPRSIISIVRHDDLAPLERHYMYNGHTTRLMFGEKTVSGSGRDVFAADAIAAARAS